LFHEVMLAAMRGRSPSPLLDHTGLTNVEVCELSGERASDSCPHRRREWFTPGSEPGVGCQMHELVAIDPQTSLRAGPACRDRVERVFERYPHEYENFARQAGRPLSPREFAARCPGSTAVESRAAPELVFPNAAAEFLIDPGLPRDQEIMLEARSASDRLTFFVDDCALGTLRAPFRLPWRLRAGVHRVRVATPEGQQSELVAFQVR